MKATDNKSVMRKFATQIFGDKSDSKFAQFVNESDQHRLTVVSTVFNNQYEHINENQKYYETHYRQEDMGMEDARSIKALENLFESAHTLGLTHKVTGELQDHVMKLASGGFQITDMEKALNEGLNPEEAEDGRTDYSELLTEGIIAGDANYDATNIAAGISSGNLITTGPAMLGIIKRIIPNLVAFDLCGVQSTSVPTQQIIMLRAMEGKYGLESEKELFHPEFAPNADFSGFGAGIQQKFTELAEGITLEVGKSYKIDGAFDGNLTEAEIEADAGAKWLNDNGAYGTRFVQTLEDNFVVTFTGDIDNIYAWVQDNITKGKIVFTSSGMATRIAELQEGFNDSVDNEWAEVSFRLDKKVSDVKERRLKAQASLTSITDARTTLGIDVMALLHQIIQDEMKQELNREIIEWVNATAVIGKSGRSNTEGSEAGRFNIMQFADTKGGYDLGQRAKALMYQITKECVETNRRTGRGVANTAIASPEVVNFLRMVDGHHGNSFEFGVGGTSLQPDTSKTTQAGSFIGIKLLTDQYAHTNYITTGYVGGNAMDSGIVYSPYVMFIPYQAQNPNTFTPIIGYLSRYAITVNPFAEPRIQKPSGRNEVGLPDTSTFRRNAYYRYMEIMGL